MPEFDNDSVEQEYDRTLKLFEKADPYSSDATIGLHDVLAAHFLIVDYFYSVGFGLGGIGPRDPEILHSAVYRQFVSFGGVDKWSTPFEKIATLFYGLVKDHPFYDANKRTGLLVVLIFLQRMQRVPTVGQRELENFAVSVASGGLAKKRRYSQLVKKKVDNPDVVFIADYLRRNSRKIDNTRYSITFQQLNRILDSFGYCLKNPNGNYIDVVRTEQRQKLFGFGAKESVDVKIAQVGFPGWKKQVNQGAIQTIRKEAKLTAKDGFDSQTFYKGADPIPGLIAEYSAPLERLADR